MSWFLGDFTHISSTVKMYGISTHQKKHTFQLGKAVWKCKVPEMHAYTIRSDLTYAGKLMQLKAFHMKHLHLAPLTSPCLADCTTPPLPPLTLI